MPVNPNANMTEQKRLFCERYVALGCKWGAQTQAAKEAGYEESSAGTKASQLMAERGVKKYISELRFELQKDAPNLLAAIQETLSAIAFTRIDDITEVRDVYKTVKVKGTAIDDEGVIKEVEEEREVVIGTSLEVIPLEEWPEQALKSGVEITGSKDGSVRVKQGDKLAAIRQLRELHGWIAPKESTLNVNIKPTSENLKKGASTLKRRANVPRGTLPDSEPY